MDGHRNVNNVHFDSFIVNDMLSTVPQSVAITVYCATNRQNEAITPNTEEKSSSLMRNIVSLAEYNYIEFFLILCCLIAWGMRNSPAGVSVPLYPVVNLAPSVNIVFNLTSLSIIIVQQILLGDYNQLQIRIWLIIPNTLLCPDPIFRCYGKHRRLPDMYDNEYSRPPKLHPCNARHVKL